MDGRWKIDNAAALRRKLGGFDRWLERKGYPYKTYTRLAQYLEVDKETISNYIKGKHKTENLDSIDYEEYLEVRETLSLALRDIAAGYEDLLFQRDSARGAEFTLKNNFDWRDKQEIAQDSTITVRMGEGIDKLGK